MSRLPLFATAPILLPILLIAGCTAFSNPNDSSSTKPDDNRFTPVVLTEGPTLDEPMAFEVLNDGRVFIIERKGGVKVFHPAGKTVTLAATIPVNTKYTNAEGNVREAEEGLVGLTVHPDFENHPWIYLLYAHPDEPKHVLARWEVRDNRLVDASRIVMLDYPVQRETCCHTGGGMLWDADGNLFITIGNNSGNSRGSQTDERPGRSSWDDQRGAGNTNDFRGKILRIHPEPDGSYTIPDGNLFPPGAPDTRPEIYTMGHRNAWRISMDSQTGFIYWGEVGPDATEDTEIGPRGYDELNQARAPGNFGWPYFIGENHAYPYFDFTADQPLAPKDPAKPTNHSVNNTGLQELPPAQPAFISYPYGVSERFPLVGSGGRSATGGPIYRRADFENAARPFPSYYEGKWLAADLSRGWIMAITIDRNGDYVSMERFLPSYKPAEIIDQKFGPEGDLYVLEYGSRWFSDSEDDKLVRIEYNADNRTPLAAASADKTGGVTPFDLSLSAEGSMDYDGDALIYRWELVSEADSIPRVYAEANPTVSFDEAGVYTATLTVTDPAGASNNKSITIIAGNEPPEVALHLEGNKSFFFSGVPIRYAVEATDPEDGSLEGGQIEAAQVSMSIDYVSEGFDYAEVIQGQRSVDASTRFAVAEALMRTSNCSVCHQVDVRSAGPAYTEIAEKYRSDPGAPGKLVEKIRQGGSGVWGEIMMPANPRLTLNDATTIVKYILSIQDQTLATLPMSGQYVPVLSDEDDVRGSVIMRTAYTDRGVGDVPSQTAERMIVLRSATLSPGSADVIEGATTSVGGRGAGPVSVHPRRNGHIAFEQIDLTGIVQVELTAQARSREGFVGGTVELRLDGPEGPLLGRPKWRFPLLGSVLLRRRRSNKRPGRLRRTMQHDPRRTPGRLRRTMQHDPRRTPGRLRRTM